MRVSTASLIAGVLMTLGTTLPAQAQSPSPSQTAQSPSQTRSLADHATATTTATGAAAPAAGAIGGVVVDTSGGAVNGAAVTLRAGGSVERRALSDAAGRFWFPDAPDGPATVTVTFDRFDPVTIDAAHGRTDLRIVLKPVALTEQITVRASRLTIERMTTATKTDTPLRDVPQSVTVVTRDLIADQGMQNMADVVRTVPGIGMAQGEGNRDAPIFRGNSSTSDFFVDGVRDDVQYFRDLYNVERVEAFKGPNAMIFGRGGVGGVINRVTRQANGAPTRELALQGGSWNSRRVSGDVGQAVNAKASLRLTGVYENSDSYRDGVSIERYGVNPTAAFTLGSATTLRIAYEYFHDDRIADRGIPSLNGRPVSVDRSTFFGNAASSPTWATVNSVSAVLEHRLASNVTLRNRVNFSDYDKFYQNVFPGAVNAAAATVNLSAYNNATQRQNVFNQTDVIVNRRTGALSHTLLAGLELGRQVTDNFRETGFFDTLGPTVTSVNAPLANPITTLPLTFRQAASDADNHGTATVAGVYVQDQIAFSPRLQAIVGLRYDRFDVDFRNNRTAAEFSSRDGLVSPRVGLVYKPAAPVSLYASYSLSYLPRAGEQLGSLSLTNQALDPEDFRNYEVGAKWDTPAGLSVTAAVYRLDRGNVVVPDPNDPTVSLLVDAQRSKGLELGLAGNLTRAWSIAAAYAYQVGEITQSLSATAQAGATLAQLPRNSLSLWTKYEITPRWGAGLGIVSRADIFTSTDNLVVLPSYTRADAAVFFTLNAHLRAQVNFENLFDATYFASAHSNNNITPGSPRAVRAVLTTRF